MRKRHSDPTSCSTLLMIILRNATTDSPWPICNNPHGQVQRSRPRGLQSEPPALAAGSSQHCSAHLFSAGGGDRRKGRSSFSWMAASPPTTIRHSSFSLWPPLEPYRLQWETGEDKMLIVSVGTGTSPEANANLQPGEMNLLYQAGSIPARSDVCRAERAGFPVPRFREDPGWLRS